MSVEPRQKALWLRELQLNGFVVLRDFLPVNWVAAVHDQLMPIMLGEYKKCEQQNFATGRGPGRVAFDVGRYADLLGPPLADDLYRKNAVIEELVAAILGPDSWARGWTMIETAWRGSTHMMWHSDQKIEDTPDPDGPHEPLRVTYNIPLVDFTWANGATEFIPGSHRLPRSFLNHSFLDIPNIYAVRVELRRGDAMLRDGNASHRGTPNLTEEPRAMLDQTYKKKAAV